MNSGAKYEVSAHHYGRPVVQAGPMAGCVGFDTHGWTRLTNRPLGLARAIELADRQSGRAVVVVWQTSQTVYDNQRSPVVPAGWREPVTPFCRPAKTG